MIGMRLVVAVVIALTACTSGQSGEDRAKQLEPCTLHGSAAQCARACTAPAIVDGGPCSTGQGSGCTTTADVLGFVGCCFNATPTEIDFEICTTPPNPAPTPS